MSSLLVLLVEDDAVVAGTLRVYLEQAGYAVDVVTDGHAALARGVSPDVALVVLDWMLPGLNGQEVCRRLRAVSRVPILMLTARTAEDDRVLGLESGADDYVPKPFSPREVVARVQALLRRTGAATPSAPAPPTVMGDLEIDHFGRDARVAGRTVSLTTTEFRLLEALAGQAGRVFTRDELVARAFGPDYDGMDRTIDTHIANLRRKLGAPSGRRYIHTVHGTGYRLSSAAGVDGEP